MDETAIEREVALGSSLWGATQAYAAEAQRPDFEAAGRPPHEVVAGRSAMLVAYLVAEAEVVAKRLRESPPDARGRLLPAAAPLARGIASALRHSTDEAWPPGRARCQQALAELVAAGPLEDMLVLEALGRKPPPVPEPDRKPDPEPKPMPPPRAKRRKA